MILDNLSSEFLLLHDRMQLKLTKGRHDLLGHITGKSMDKSGMTGQEYSNDL